MATNSKRGELATIQLSQPIIAIAEFLPKLSVINLFICNLNSSSEIVVGERSIRVSKFNIVLYFENIRFVQPDSPKVTFVQSTLHCRLIVQPVQTVSGSFATQIIEKSSSAYESTLKHLFTASQNEMILTENEFYSVQCRSCSQHLVSNISFVKIRQLPGFSWEERANDLWYCHPPHEHEHKHPKTEDCINTVTEQVKKINLEETSRNIISILTSPDHNMCLYGPCFWIIHKKHIQDTLVRCTGVSSVAVCSDCKSEVGIFTSDQSIQLWNSGIIWTKDTSTGPLKEIENPALEDFKKIVCSIIRESTNLFTCKFLLKCVDSDEGIFLWNLDRNLTIFTTTLNASGEEVSLKLKPQRSVKLMFSTTLHDPFIDFSDLDQQVTVPNRVFVAGLIALQTTSSYSSETSLKSGYLIY